MFFGLGQSFLNVFFNKIRQRRNLFIFFFLPQVYILLRVRHKFFSFPYGVGSHSLPYITVMFQWYEYFIQLLSESIGNVFAMLVIILPRQKINKKRTTWFVWNQNDVINSAPYYKLRKQTWSLHVAKERCERLPEESEGDMNTNLRIIYRDLTVNALPHTSRVLLLMTNPYRLTRGNHHLVSVTSIFRTAFTVKVDLNCKFKYKFYRLPRFSIQSVTSVQSIQSVTSVSYTSFTGKVDMNRIFKS